ncbi:MAG: DUF6435 family protein [Planctomycetota bacterium]
MFGKKKNASGSGSQKRLQKEYEALLQQARDLQRSGDIRGYAEKMAQADEVAKRLDAATSGS